MTLHVRKKETLQLDPKSEVPFHKFRFVSTILDTTLKRVEFMYNQSSTTRYPLLTVTAHVLIAKLNLGRAIQSFKAVFQELYVQVWYFFALMQNFIFLRVSTKRLTYQTNLAACDDNHWKLGIDERSEITKYINS